MKQVTKVLWGVVLVIFGLILALKALGIADIDLFFPGWWTLIIIIPSAIGMFTDKDKTGAVIGLTVGLFLLLWRLGYIDLRLLLRLAIPAAIIIIGLKLIFGGAFDKKKQQLLKNLRNTTGFRHSSANFTNQKDDCTNQTFNGAEYITVCGKIESDISKAFFERDVLISVKNILGTVNITVPAGVNVNVISHSFFGGVTNPIQNNDGSNVVTIYVQAFCLLGNVELIPQVNNYNAGTNFNN